MHQRTHIQQVPMKSTSSLFRGLMIPIDLEDQNETRASISHGAMDIRSSTPPPHHTIRSKSRHYSEVDREVDRGFNASSEAMLALKDSSIGGLCITEFVRLSFVFVFVFVTIVLADVLRGSGTRVPSVIDWIALSISLALTWSNALYSLLRMWKTLDRRIVAQPQLSHTLLELVMAYMLCILAFATLYCFVLLTREDLQLALLPTLSKPGLGLRTLDGLYVITFIATGVGFPHPSEQSLPIEARVVAWATAFLMSTFIGKLVVVTALSVRLNT